MNSRFENGSMTLPNKESVLQTVYDWTKTDNVSILSETDSYISYIDNDRDEGPKKIYFPETDSLKRIRKAITCESDALKYIDPDYAAEFIYNHIDMNGLANTEHIVFFLKEFTFNNVKYSSPIDRKDLMNKSVVAINIQEIIDETVSMSRLFADEYFFMSDFSKREQLIKYFEKYFVVLLCAEFRRAVYGINDFTPVDGSDEGYPEFGGFGTELVRYGFKEYERIIKESASYSLLRKTISPLLKNWAYFEKENDYDFI